jgi:uncharacterized protein
LSLAVAKINCMSDANGDAPWYQDGLRFKCTQCGNCCTGAPGYVWLTDAELEVIATFLREPLVEVRAVHTRDTHRGRSLRERANGDCVFYDPQTGCTIYPVRPAQCRTWPFWNSNVKTKEAWEHTCKICPGSGKGDLIPPEEITRRLNVVKL